jgi:hypothetical protein
MVGKAQNQTQVMLLVTFHGGKSGINNIYAFSTKDGRLKTKAALSAPNVKLRELRAMAIWNGNLFVVNGSRDTSNVLVFKGPPKKGKTFHCLGTMIGRGDSIAHPYGIGFTSSSMPTACYVSDQDSNVVAKVNLSKGKYGGVIGMLRPGCQAGFLSEKYTPREAFLKGTFVASQIGALAGLPAAPNVATTHGGLGVKGSGTPLAPIHSVRDVAIARGILFVCDEADSRIKMYALKSGAPLGSASLIAGPTHLAIFNGGLWVSARQGLWWSALPRSASKASLSFKSVTIGVPRKKTIGGISFDRAGSVYVVLQDGTGGTGTGSIQKYKVRAGPPPELSDGLTFATLPDDTPEFCLWVSNSHWPGPASS